VEKCTGIGLVIESYVLDKKRSIVLIRVTSIGVVISPVNYWQTRRFHKNIGNSFAMNAWELSQTCQYPARVSMTGPWHLHLGNGDVGLFKRAK
jgi:hypothetical protein